MRRAAIVFGLGLLLAVNSLCQQTPQNTVFATAFSGAVTAGVSATFRNVGQQYHHLDVYIGASAVNCTNVLSIYLEGSNDGINFTPFSTPITAVGNFVGTGTSFKCYAGVTSSDAWQYVRAHYQTVYNDGAVEPLYAYYSGTTAAGQVSSQPFNAINDSFSYLTGSYSTMGSTTLASCANGLLQIYSIALSATGGANTVTITSSGTSATTAQMKWLLTTSSPNIVLPQGSRPYLVQLYTSSTFSPNTSFSLGLSAATEVDYAIAYRCEN